MIQLCYPVPFLASLLLAVVQPDSSFIPVHFVEFRDEFTDEVTDRMLWGVGKKLHVTIGITCRSAAIVEMENSILDAIEEYRGVRPRGGGVYRLFLTPPIPPPPNPSDQDDSDTPPVETILTDEEAQEIIDRIGVKEAAESVDFRLGNAPIMTFKVDLRTDETMSFEGRDVDEFIQRFESHDQLRIRVQEGDRTFVEEHDISLVGRSALLQLDCQ